MKNNGLFSSLFIEDLKDRVTLDDAAQGRMATLAQRWRARNTQDSAALWESLLKQALGYLEFVPSGQPSAPGVYPLYEDWGFSECISVLYLVPPGSNIDDTSIGRFHPAKLLAQLKERDLNWGILTDGSHWRLYSTKSSRPYEDCVELVLGETLEDSDDAEYGLFERFFHKDSFVPDLSTEGSVQAGDDGEAEEIGPKECADIRKCRLDHDRDQSEQTLEERVKKPFLAQVDEVLQYICNGFIFDTRKAGEEYTEQERTEIFESAVKLIYRCLFLFYAEARRLLPTEREKADLYRRHSIQALCGEARKFRWGKRHDTDQYDLWKHLKGLINAVNDGDPEYGIMGYDGGLFDDEEEEFLGRHQLRNDFLARALYLLAFVEPFDNNEPDSEYPIPYEDLEVRHLGELYETILEYTVLLADADRVRHRTKKGTEILLASQTARKAGDTLIRKGEVYFGESALERKQTGSYYTPESLVRFLNQKTIVQPLYEIFEHKYRQRFNALLVQANKGHDIGTRRGAAQSAAALVQRFAEEEVLNFKVCDPAMGSGHFLVDAANQMAGLVIALLAEVPYIDGLTVSVSSAPNDWQRRITRNCIYGVDLNPLAVNLAKLSLWLNCFASQHRLTFLDHHVRCGNSLVGVRHLRQLATIPERKNQSPIRKNQQPLLFDYNDLSDALSKAATRIASITRIDEDDTDSQKAVLDEAVETTSSFRPLADLYTAYLMAPNISASDYKHIFERIAAGKSLAGALNSSMQKKLASVETRRDWHRFFHWPLEFPDVFGTSEVGGFSATVGNPPWDIVKPNSQEFFSDYDPRFRSYDKQKANRVSAKLMSDNPTIAEKWQQYCEGLAEHGTYFKEPITYNALGSGDINTFKLFLEQFFTVLGDAGRMGIVVPSGIYTDQGCRPLRELFFGDSRIEFLYCFENRHAVFNIHRSFKFVLFGTQKGGSTDQFKCAFMQHDPERLPAIDDDALLMTYLNVRRFSPDSLSMMEFETQRDIDVASTLYRGHHLLVQYLSERWDTAFQREFHMTDDSEMFHEKNEISDSEIVPLWEGKQIWILTSNFSEPTNWMRLNDAAIKPTTQKTRLVYRALAANTNERTFIPTVIPAPFPTGHSLYVCPLPSREAVILCAILGSFTIDWILRNKVTTNVSIFLVGQLPIVDIGTEDKRTQEITEALLPRACRLVCTTSHYAKIWGDCFANKWTSPDYWYPSNSLKEYGPAHERAVREELLETVRGLTPRWTTECGADGRLQGQDETGIRAQLRAEIDACVAHLYGLSREEFAYILDTFPVLKKKEEKAFGEFMSKRKCLEEYDRIGKVIAGGRE